MLQRAESLVLQGLLPEKLKYNAIEKGSVTLFRQDLNAKVLCTYKEGADYTVDYANGTVSRTENSAVPDFCGHIFYCAEHFIHRNDIDYSNAEYLLYIDYRFDAKRNVTAAQTARRRTSELKTPKLKAWAEQNRGKTVSHLLLGDSISSGGDVAVGKSYFERLKVFLRKTYDIDFIVYNHTVPGYPITVGYDKLKKVIDEVRYDSASIAFGMNDQNLFGGKSGIPLDAFAHTLEEMIAVLASRNIQVFTVTSCFPNKLWHFNSNSIALYNAATVQVSQKLNVPVADAGYMWTQELLSGKLDSGLLYNNINHPSDYGQALYFEIVKTLF